MRIRAILCVPVILAASACSTTPPPQEPRAMSGIDLYQQLCSSCHGVDARGTGPVAPLIKTGVPDLTQLAPRNGGEFPNEEVRRTIDGRWDRTAHGARDMPVWGWQLYDASSGDPAYDRSVVDSMIDRLADYLRSIQRN